MNVYRRFVPAHLRFLVVVHLILLGIFSLFRYITLLYNRPSYFFEVDRTLPLRDAFRIGLSFDITVASYALLIPYILLTVSFIWPRNYRKLFGFVRFYCGLAIIISLVICAADIPYFNFFNSRLTSSAVTMKNNVQVIKYVISEVKYYPFILISLVCIWGVRRLIKLIWTRAWAPAEHGMQTKLIATLSASFLLMFGLWGGATPKAPDMKSATFSNDGFINQLTLNPVHTWFDSYFDFDIHVFSLQTALERVQKELGIQRSYSGVSFESPIARTHQYEAPAKKMNVVLVLIESMSAARMGIFGNEKNLTPGLDSLARNSIFFDNCYSNGMHTNAGLYSSIYGMPIMMMQHPMTNGVSEYCDFTGLPVTLKNMGYSTSFFCTHPKTFDNLDVFLQHNGYDRISDVSDYPADKIANSWGVGDETLFEYALQNLDSLSTDPSGKPFFATLLTITTHPPFILPAFTKFKPRSTDPIEITYEYSDWSIRNFMNSCADKPWYNNTIFVFVGDHGVNLPSQYDVPLSYNHVPLIVHAPGLFKKPETRHDQANQMDIYPTIMGMIGEDYTQNTLGYDLFHEKRPYSIFSQDHKMGVINDRYLYVARKSGTESLYDYQSGSPDDVIKQHPELAEEMRSYACSQLLVSQWMIHNKLTGDPARLMPHGPVKME